MFVKIHKSYRIVVAICDSDLIGKKFDEGEKEIFLRENFYKDKEVSFDEAVKILKFQAREDATFNIVGEESIRAGKEVGIVSGESIGRIAGIPYALVLL